MIYICDVSNKKWYFQPFQKETTGEQPIGSVKAACWDGDGDYPLVVTNIANWKITILMGKITGSMAISNSYVSHYQRVPLCTIHWCVKRAPHLREMRRRTRWIWMDMHCWIWINGYDNLLPRSGNQTWEWKKPYEWLWLGEHVVCPKTNWIIIMFHIPDAPCMEYLPTFTL